MTSTVAAPGATRTPPKPPRRKAVSPWRFALLLPGGLALLAGLDAALLLLGVPAPVTTGRLPDVHGVLLVVGFVGTLVALERSVALGHRAGFLSPALLGAGGVLLVSPAPLAAGQGVQLAGRSRWSRSTYRCGAASATTRSWSRPSARCWPSAPS